MLSRYLGGGRVYSIKKKNHRNSDFSFIAGGLEYEVVLDKLTNLPPAVIKTPQISI
jgi:hypothetical protein